MDRDATYALTEVFALVAASHNQFLNLMRKKLEVYQESEEHEDLKILKYFKQLLFRQIAQLEEVGMALRNTTNPKWPKVERDSGHDHSSDDHRADAAKKAIVSDFAYLTKYAQQLHAQSSEAINVLMNSVSIADSRQQMREGERIGKLTFVTFIFAPLSFTTSFFGMNVRLLVGADNARASVLVWVAVTLPLLAFTLGAFFFTRQAAEAWMARVQAVRAKRKIS